jgi:hypothetical protein
VGAYIWNMSLGEAPRFFDLNRFAPVLLC